MQEIYYAWSYFKRKFWYILVHKMIEKSSVGWYIFSLPFIVDSDWQKDEVSRQTRENVTEKRLCRTAKKWIDFGFYFKNSLASSCL